MFTFAIFLVDLLNRGYTYISARPVSDSSSTQSVIKQPEDVCLLTAGWQGDMYCACVVQNGVVVGAEEYWKKNNKILYDEFVLIAGTSILYD